MVIFIIYFLPDVGYNDAELFGLVDIVEGLVVEEREVGEQGRH